MHNETVRRIRLIYGIVLSAATVVAGLCLMAACLGIYLSGGDDPFSRETVARSFSGIAVPVYLCLALAIGGFLLELALPVRKKRTPMQKQYSLILQQQYEKADMSACNPALAAKLRREQRLRRLHLGISLGLLLLGCAIFLAYALNIEDFHPSDVNGSMIRAMYVLLPCLAVPFGYSVFSAYFSRGSIRRETELVKLAPRAVGKAAPEAKKAPSRGLLAARVVITVLAAAILLYGFFAGGTADVLTKAVNICTECVGLG